MLSSKGIGKFQGFGDKQIKLFNSIYWKIFPGGVYRPCHLGKKYENGREKGEKCKRKRRMEKKKEERGKKNKEREKKKEEKKRKENGRKKRKEKQ